MIAGHGRCKEAFPKVKAELDRRNLDYAFHFTTKPLDASDIAQRMRDAGYTHIVAMGGDGTVNEVACGLIAAGAPLPLAVIPAGGGNDFARMNGIPTEPIQAIDILVKGEDREIDLGYIVGDRYFVNGLGVGLDAQVARNVHAMKRLRGEPAYLYAVVKEIFRFKGFPLSLTGEGWSEEYTCLSFGVMNGRYVGGGFKLAPQAVNDDGLLDISSIEDFSIAERLIHLPKTRTGAHLKLSNVHYRQSPTVTVSSPAKLVAHLDGEIYRLPKQPFTVTVVPKALRALVPR